MELWIQIGLITLGALISLAVLVTALCRRRGIGGLLSSGVQGLLTLGAVHLLGGFFPVSLGVGWLTAGTAALLGIPGVTTLLLLNVILPPL